MNIAARESNRPFLSETYARTRLRRFVVAILSIHIILFTFTNAIEKSMINPSDMAGNGVTNTTRVIDTWAGLELECRRRRRRRGA